MLNFQKRKKKYFNITLHDGTKLRIPTPTLEFYNEINYTISNIENVENEDVRAVIKAVLALNKEGIEITDGHIDEFDTEDICEFFMEYMVFVQGVLSDPNFNSLIAQQKQAVRGMDMK